MAKHGIGIIKGLWGDETLRRRRLLPPDAFEAVKEGVRSHAASTHSVDKVYCYGGQNKQFLRGLGYHPVKLHDRPWMQPDPNKRLNARFLWNGGIRNGYSYWWHKFKIIEAALHEFSGGVLWTDFDVLQKQDNIDWIYDDLAKGKPIRASLYVQHNWTWGAGWRHSTVWKVPGTEIAPDESHTAARLVLGCGFLFIRSLDIVREALKIQDEFTHFLDHQVMSLLFDRMHGGRWIGPEEYVAQGWHTQGYYYGRQLYPPRRSKIAFQAGEKSKRRIRV